MRRVAHSVLMFLTATAGFADHREGATGRAPVPGMAGDGVYFSCSPPEIQEIKKQMLSLLVNDYQWGSNFIEVIEGDSGRGLQFRFRPAINVSTNTLKVKERAELGIENEVVGTVRRGRPVRKSISSKKEIVAQMFSPGRLTSLVGKDCSFDKFLDILTLRQNVAKACATSAMHFPQSRRKINDRFWSPDFTVKQGQSAIGAINDIITGEYTYHLGCTTAVRAIEVQASFDHYGDSPEGRRFINELVGNDPLKDADGEFDDKKDRITDTNGRLIAIIDSVPHDNWHTGDWGYMRNNNLPSRPENGGAQGQEGTNLVYIGGGKFCSYYDAASDDTLDAAFHRVYAWGVGHKKPEGEIGDNWRRSPAEHEDGMLSSIRAFPKLLPVDISSSKPVREDLSMLLTAFKHLGGGESSAPAILAEREQQSENSSGPPESTLSSAQRQLRQAQSQERTSTYRGSVASEGTENAEASTARLYCQASGGLFRVADRETNKAYGRAVDKNACQFAVKTAREGFYCQPVTEDVFQMADQSHQSVGRAVVKEDCLFALESVRGALFCKPIAVNVFTVADRKTHAHRGKVTDQQECKFAIDSQRDGYYCRPSGAGWFYMTEVKTDKVVGQIASESDCLFAVNSRVGVMSSQPRPAPVESEPPRAATSRVPTVATAVRSDSRVPIGIAECERRYSNSDLQSCLAIVTNHAFHEGALTTCGAIAESQGFVRHLECLKIIVDKKYDAQAVKLCGEVRHFRDTLACLSFAANKGFQVDAHALCSGGFFSDVGPEKVDCIKLLPGIFFDEKASQEFQSLTDL